ncbi:MAG: hypothetical protein ACXWRE_13300 [Pseudobdellovibrionaceae bacterium]
MKYKFNFILSMLCFLCFSQKLYAGLTCEVSCEGYYETTSTSFGTGSNKNEAGESAVDSCHRGGGLRGADLDCLSHGSYYDCTVQCRYPQRLRTSSYIYVNERSEADGEARKYCDQYYQYHKNELNFWVYGRAGACR